MTNSELTQVLFLLLLLVGLAQLLGWLFVKMRQPKVVGEILAGVVLGNASSGACPLLPASLRAPNTRAMFWILFTGWDCCCSCSLPARKPSSFSLATSGAKSAGSPLSAQGCRSSSDCSSLPGLSGPSLAGPNGNRISLTIILAVGVAVTSVPVVSKIFADLKILHTRFARLVLGVAVLEDIVLWLALAVATATAGKAVLDPRAMSYHLLATVAFFVLGLTIVPRLIKRINKARFNVLARHSPAGYAIAVLLAYCAVAGALDISLVFAAFLAGFAVVHKKRRLFAEALDAIGKVSFAFFIPVYFAVVGLKLDLIRGVSLWMMVAFIAGTCIVKVFSVSLAARFAGFRGLDLINLAITTNARGGPGIVLASVAFDAGIISSKFYTTLVVAAVLTSQIAGAWLDYVLRKGWPLLAAKSSCETIEINPESPSVAGELQ